MTTFQAQDGISARRYSEFLDSLPVAIYRTTIEGKLIFCNKAFANIFGFNTVNELVGSPIIGLYKNKKDRGLLISHLLKRGRVMELPILFQRNDGTPIWCSLSARVVLDEGGVVLFLDGTLREITKQIDDKVLRHDPDGMVDTFQDIIIFIDLKGEILEINKACADLLDYSKEHLVGEPMVDYIDPRHRELFLIFLADILKIGRDEGIISVVDRSGDLHHVEFNALLVKSRGRASYIKASGRDITEKIKKQKEKSNKEKFEGVLEMAGGVAHRLSQPLTVINNIIDEVMTDLDTESVIHSKLARVNEQVKKLNDITKKIGSIKKYEAMDYVAGIRIVDIDKAS
jgi:PAS domain S-box-containing protein